MKRYTLTQEEIQRLVDGDDIALQLSPQRTIVLGTKSDVEIKKERLRERYEAELAKLEQSSS